MGLCFGVCLRCRPCAAGRFKCRCVSIIAAENQHRTGRNLAAQRHGHAGIPRLGRSLNGRRGDVLLRGAGNQNRVVRLSQLIVVAPGNKQIRASVPVGHSTDAPARLQGLRQRDFLVRDGFGGFPQLNQGDGGAVLNLEPIICRVHPDGVVDVNFLSRRRVKNPLVAGHGNVQRSGSRLQSLFVNGNVRVGVGLEALAVLIHHFQRLRLYIGIVGAALGILTRRGVDAGNDLIAHLQRNIGFKRACHCSGGDLSLPQDKAGSAVIRVKPRRADVGVHRHIAAFHRVVQLHLNIYGICILLKWFGAGFPVLQQHRRGIGNDLLPRLFPGGRNGEIIAEYLLYIVIFGISQLHAELASRCQLSGRNIQRHIPYCRTPFFCNRVVLIVPVCIYRQKKYIHRGYFRVCTVNAQRNLCTVRRHGAHRCNRKITGGLGTHRSRFGSAVCCQCRRNRKC